jgi:hypothetical protein
VAVVALVKYKKWVALSLLLDKSQCLPTYPLPCTLSWMPHGHGYHQTITSSKREISTQPEASRNSRRMLRAKPKEPISDSHFSTEKQESN